MRKHEDSEHAAVKPEPQQCLICNTWYRNLDGLKTHQKNMHVDEGVEHRCHICNKTSTTNRALKRHIYLNHICEKKFKCTMCEKAFKRKQDLKVSCKILLHPKATFVFMPIFCIIGTHIGAYG